MKCQFLINGIPCGTVIPNGEKFCANCGAPASVEVEVYKCITKPCLHCGHSLTKGHKFCSNCAWKVDQSIFEQEGLTCKGVNQNGVVCGQKLLPSAKFCPECATPVLHRVTEHIQEKGIAEKEANDSRPDSEPQNTSNNANDKHNQWDMAEHQGQGLTIDNEQSLDKPGTASRLEDSNDYNCSPTFKEENSNNNEDNTKSENLDLNPSDKVLKNFTADEPDGGSTMVSSKTALVDEMSNFSVKTEHATESEVDPVQKSVNNTEQLELVFGAMKNTNGKSQAEDQNVTNQASTRKNQMRDESLQRPDRFMDSIIFGRQEDSFNETARRYEHMEDDSVIHRNDRMRKKDYQPVGDKQKKQNNEEADHKKENIDDGEISRDCSTYSSYGDREKTNPSLKRETGKKKEKKNKDEKKREKKKMKEMNSGSSEKSYDEAISSISISTGKPEIKRTDTNNIDVCFHVVVSPTIWTNVETESLFIVFVKNDTDKYRLCIDRKLKNGYILASLTLSVLMKVGMPPPVLYYNYCVINAQKECTWEYVYHFEELTENGFIRKLSISSVHSKGIYHRYDGMVREDPRPGKDKTKWSNLKHLKQSVKNFFGVNEFRALWLKDAELAVLAFQPDWQLTPITPSRINGEEMISQVSFIEKGLGSVYMEEAYLWHGSSGFYTMFGKVATIMKQAFFKI